MPRRDPARRTLVYASAGHIQGYVIDASGATKHVLGSTGLPLGLFGDAEFRSGPELDLERGDVLLLLTDGATEAQRPDGEFYDCARVLQAVAETRGEDAAQTVRRLHAAVSAFASGQPQQDDVTAVVCRVLG